MDLNRQRLVSFGSAGGKPPGFIVHTLHLADPPADPIALLAQPELAGGPQFYWSAPDTGEIIAATGAVYQTTAHGPGRLAAIRDQIAVQVADPGVDAGGDLSAVPVGDVRWMGGFAFDDTPGGADPVPGADRWQGFPSAWFVLPAITLIRDATGTRLVLVARDVVNEAANSTGAAHLAERGEALAARLAESGRRASSQGQRGGPKEAATDPRNLVPALLAHVHLSDAERTALAQRIEAVLAAIDRGEVVKVVMATAHQLSASSPLDPVYLLRALGHAQPDTFRFLVSPGPGLAMSGATPERLVRAAAGRLTTMALAGSARRDPDPTVDRELGRALLASAKDRSEHALVVDAIRAALNDLPLEVPAAPRLRRLARIQHLETPIEARLAAGADVLDFAQRLHPTPALGGTPRERALALIRALEGDRRGWYGGGVGWLDGRGNGDLAVAIRSLLVRGTDVTAFAGAGIVAGSDPAKEVAEIELKLRAVLDCLPADLVRSRAGD